MNVLAHRYLADSMPACSLAPWSVNRAVNKLMHSVNTKLTDHPRQYLGLLSAEPELMSPSIQYHRDSTAFGKNAIPRLLHRVRTTKNEEHLVMSLKTLVEMLHDPEKIAEALNLNVLNPLPKLMSHNCSAVQSYTFALLLQVSRLPYGKIQIISRQRIMNHIAEAFDSTEFSVRETAYALVSGLSSNWIVVERLVDFEFVKLIMNALEHLLLELDIHQTAIVHLLRALTNMTDHEKAIWQILRYDGFHLKRLLFDKDEMIRQETADLFYNILSSPVGKLTDVSVGTSKLILSALEKEDPPMDAIPLLALTTINSEARYLVLNSEKVITTLLDFYRRPKIPISLRLSLHNVLTNAAEMPLARSVLRKHITDISLAKTYNLIPEELMESLIGIICERSDS